MKKGGRMVSWRWKLSPEEQIVNQLRAANVQLRRQLTTKTNLANGLQLALHQRHETIDALRGRIDALRKQNKQLDAENDRLAEMVRLS
jgi:polyhydroxyalkanoate synthesis regulator phasin